MGSRFKRKQKRRMKVGKSKKKKGGERAQNGCKGERDDSNAPFLQGTPSPCIQETKQVCKRGLGGKVLYLETGSNDAPTTSSGGSGGGVHNDKGHCRRDCQCRRCRWDGGLLRVVRPHDDAITARGGRRRGESGAAGATRKRLRARTSRRRDGLTRRVFSARRERRQKRQRTRRHDLVGNTALSLVDRSR